MKNSQPFPWPRLHLKGLPVRIFLPLPIQMRFLKLVPTVSSFSFGRVSEHKTGNLQ